MAALTATLSKSGELIIKGTDANDQIAVSQSGTKISVKGVAGTFNEASVKTITVNTFGGDDVVTFTGFKLNYNKAIKVVNSSGIDQVTHIGGAKAIISSGSVTRAANGRLTVNSQALDWFDTNIQDAALRSLLKTGFGDKVIDRKEMLQLFTEVAKDRVVSATEFSDLTKVANNNSLFTTVEYVGVLTRDVVIGNVANATFQGTTLGNLKANASSAHLDKLVGKWFLGTDRPTTSMGGVNFAYASAKGTLFAQGGPTYTDVEQGYVGDCYFVGALGEIALKSPDAIRNMFIVNGDGTYTVRFFNNGKADYVTVDSNLPVDRYGRFVFANMGDMAGSSSNVLWVALAEKAYAQMNQSGWLRTGLPGNGGNSYSAIEGGYFSHAVRQVTNRASTTAWVGTGSFDQLKSAFDAGKFIGFASMSKPLSSSIVGGHQYVVQSYNATLQTVTLFNPWGVNNGSSYPGLVTMNWQQLVTSFSYWDRA